MHPVTIDDLGLAPGEGRHDQHRKDQGQDTWLIRQVPLAVTRPLVEQEGVRGGFEGCQSRGKSLHAPLQLGQYAVIGTALGGKNRRGRGRGPDPGHRRRRQHRRRHRGDGGQYQDPTLRLGKGQDHVKRRGMHT